MKKTIQSIITGLTAFTLFAVLQTTSAHAASITVATGNDENTDNASCSLSEAIENINDQAATNTDCPAGDGVSDTINIPSGTITLVANLPTIAEPVTITGAGMGNSVIDGDNGQYSPFIAANVLGIDSLAMSDLKVTGYKGGAVLALGTKNIDLNRIEVDGTGALPSDPGDGGSLGGIFLNATDGSNYVYDVNNVYVHDVSGDAGNLSIVSGIFILSGEEAIVEANISSSTISNIRSTGPEANNNATGITYGNFFAGDPTTTVTGVIKNVTIGNIVSDFNAAGGINATGIANDGEANYDIRIDNSTIKDIEGAINSVGIGSNAAAGAPAGVATTVVNVGNNIVSNVAGVNCDRVTDIYGGSGAGTANQSIVSWGGNLSDDASCSSDFTNPKDQNNLANLGLTLSSLSDNGGTVPTMALLQGSPAIDSGITIPTLVGDARGSVRPQGLAYDSGAYESPFTTAAATAPTVSTKLADTGQSRLDFVAVAIIALTTSLGAFIIAQLQKRSHS